MRQALAPRGFLAQVALEFADCPEDRAFGQIQLILFTEGQFPQVHHRPLFGLRRLAGEDRDGQRRCRDHLRPHCVGHVGCDSKSSADVGEPKPEFFPVDLGFAAQVGAEIQGRGAVERADLGGQDPRPGYEPVVAAPDGRSLQGREQYVHQPGDRGLVAELEYGQPRKEGDGQVRYGSQQYKQEEAHGGLTLRAEGQERCQMIGDVLATRESAFLP